MVSDMETVNTQQTQQHCPCCGQAIRSPPEKGKTHVDLIGNILCRNGQEVLLSPTIAELAYLLAQADGQYVARTEIERGVWPQGVSTNAFHVACSVLRRAVRSVGLSVIVRRRGVRLCDTEDIK